MFECQERGRSAKYKLTSTVMLVLNTATSAKAEGKGIEGAEGKGGVTLSGSMTRQVSARDLWCFLSEILILQTEVDYPLTTSAAHIPNIGRMVEDME